MRPLLVVEDLDVVERLRLHVSGVLGAAIWLVNRDAFRLPANDTFEKKQAAKQTEDVGFGGMLLGAGALMVGGAVLGAAAVVE